MTPQHISTAGAFIVRQQVGQHMSVRVVQTDEMLRTYLKMDGSPLDLVEFRLANCDTLLSETA